MNPVFESEDIFEMEEGGFDKIFIKVIDIEFVVSFDVEVADSEESIDDIHFFAKFS